MNPVVFSSKDSTWPTPQYLFDWLNARFHFTLDVCAVENSAKCERYFSPKENGLIQDWSKDRCYMNPPYGKDIKYWVQKAHEESLKGALVVGLLPAKIDTNWWWDWVQGKALVNYFHGRLTFEGGKAGAPFPSAIALWYGFPENGKIKGEQNVEKKKRRIVGLCNR